MGEYRLYTVSWRYMVNAAAVYRTISYTDVWNVHRSTYHRWCDSVGKQDACNHTLASLPFQSVFHLCHNHPCSDLVVMASPGIAAYSAPRCLTNTFCGLRCCPLLHKLGLALQPYLVSSRSDGTLCDTTRACASILFRYHFYHGEY